jgi:hypothetical protein
VYIYIYRREREEEEAARCKKALLNRYKSLMPHAVFALCLMPYTSRRVGSGEMEKRS